MRFSPTGFVKSLIKEVNMENLNVLKDNNTIIELNSKEEKESTRCEYCEGSKRFDFPDSVCIEDNQLCIEKKLCSFLHPNN